MRPSEETEMTLDKLAAGVFCLTTVVGVQTASSQVQEGSRAPLFRGVDQNMRPIDTSDFVDGTPLLFLYTSAT
jgi:hypothetical protein